MTRLVEKAELAEKIYRAVGRAISEARRESIPALTQTELARKTGGVLSRSAVANIELGRQRVAVHQLYAIAEVLRANPETLLPPIDEIFPQYDDDLNEMEVRDADTSEWFQRVLRSPDE